VLVVADPERVGELVAALSELANVEVLVSLGGDDTIDLFEARKPAVVVLTATLALGDPRSLIVILRGMVPRAEVAIVVIGDETGPVRTALDALDLAPDRFVTRPLSAKALRFAVTGGIDTVRIVRGVPPPMPKPVAIGTRPGRLHAEAGATMRLVPPVPALRPVTPNGPSTGPLAPPLPAIPTPAPPPASDDTTATRAALRARWDALADAIYEDSVDEHIDDAELADLAGPSDAADTGDAAPTPIVIKPRRQKSDSGAVTAGDLAPPREPTLIIRDPGPAVPRTQTGDDQVVVAARTTSDELWSDARSIAPVAEPSRDDAGDDLAAPLVDIDELVMERGRAAAVIAASREGELAVRAAAPAVPLDEPAADELAADELAADEPAADEPAVDEPAAESTGEVEDELADEVTGQVGLPPRDFARELRAKMSMMARRLFRGDTPASPIDHAPRHDHATEIDLASIGDEPSLDGGGELEAAVDHPADVRDALSAPVSWDTQVRERGLPDTGTIMRGVSDAAMLLAKMFAQGATGRIAFRRDEVETIVFFDHGRPVFAASNEPRDRMGELLLREGKITASQYERCQTVVAESGRRMGEILVDFGYLKRRELLPAVRRHVEDIVYSLFGWERGTYAVGLDAQPSGERIRLSRHPAALILEGIRRKLDRTSLDRLIGPPSTVVEVRDRERLGGIVSQGDLGLEERAALAAFDGQADLAQVARTAGVDLADVLPLAWGLCVLGLATARRTDTELVDEATALVGETDLAIDRERVRARWQLVTDADYFALLGVRRDATGFEIRRAYQAARRDFAADCFPSELRRELARELDDIAHVLDEAFQVLRDDRLRQTYLANLVDR
jgi:hypothetical protein